MTYEEIEKSIRELKDSINACEKALEHLNQKMDQVEAWSHGINEKVYHE